MTRVGSSRCWVGSRDSPSRMSHDSAITTRLDSSSARLGDSAKVESSRGNTTLNPHTVNTRNSNNYLTTHFEPYAPKDNIVANGL